EIGLLTAIADQVAQSILHAQLYAQAQRRVAELEALARISEAVSESLYLEESLEAIVKTTMEAVQATGAALVLEDGQVAWPEGRPGGHAVRTPLRWKRRQIGELVADRDTPFTDEERALLEAIAHHAAVALEHGRAVMGGAVLSIADDGPGADGTAAGTGLSIVHALVRDELHGSFDLRSEGGTRAEVVFPA